MDRQLKHIREFNFIRKVLRGRRKPTWIGIFVPNYQTEETIIRQLPQEFPNYNYIEIDLSRKPEGIALKRYIASFFNDKTSETDEIKTIVLLRGLNKIFGTEQEETFLKQLNFERDSLIRNFPAVFMLFMLKSYKSKLRFGAPDFWDWLQYRLDFESENEITLQSIAEFITGADFKSTEEARSEIERLEKLKKQISKQDLSEKRKAAALININLQLIDAYTFLVAYDEAMQIADETETLLKYFDDQEANAIFLDKKAKIFWLKGDFDKALEIEEKALRIRKKALGESHPSLATIFNNIAVIYQAKGDLVKALEFALKTLRIREQVLGENHPDLATSYGNIAEIYRQKGELDKAQEFALKANEIFEQVLGENHPDLATSYNNIAGIYYQKGELDKALEYALKALQIREQVLGENHPDLAKSYNNIALIYQDKGESDKALEHALKALRIRGQVLGENHPDLANSYNNIAGIYYQKGELDKALEYALKALEIREQVLGENHPDLVQSYNNIARIYYVLGDKQQAWDYINRAVEIYEKTLGSEHPKTKSAKQFRAKLQKELGETSRNVI